MPVSMVKLPKPQCDHPKGTFSSLECFTCALVLLSVQGLSFIPSSDPVTAAEFEKLHSLSGSLGATTEGTEGDAWRALLSFSPSMLENFSPK